MPYGVHLFSKSIRIAALTVSGRLATTETVTCSEFLSIVLIVESGQHCLRRSDRLLCWKERFWIVLPACLAGCVRNFLCHAHSACWLVAVRLIDRGLVFIYFPVTVGSTTETYVGQVVIDDDIFLNEKS